MNFIYLLSASVVVWINRGAYDPTAPILTLFFLLWVIQTVFIKKNSLKIDDLVRWLPWAGALLYLYRTDLLYVPTELWYVRDALRFAPALGLCFYYFRGGWNRWLGIFLMVVPLFLVVWLSPAPFIDVFTSNLQAVEYFLNGLNPYASSYPDIYGGGYDYQPGFLYWPGALLLQTFSQLVFRDIRMVLILAWVLSVFFLKAWKEWIALWLTLPFLAFGFEQAWLDPLIALGGVLTLYGLREKKNWIWVLGVVIAATVKQYGFMIGLFSVLYYVREQGVIASRKPILMMMGLFALMLGPFLWWGSSAFLEMTVFSHANAQVRHDALNFTAFLVRTTGVELSNAFQLLAILTGLGLAIYHVIKNKKDRQLAVIPEAWAVFFGFSMYFGKFAFCNYHWLLLSFMILSRASITQNQDRA